MLIPTLHLPEFELIFYYSLSKSAAWGNDPENFPETLFDYMRQKKWEREVYHDDLKRAHTAKFNVKRTKRQSRQALLKEVREKQKAADQRARTVGPLVYRNRKGRVMKTDTPGVRLTEKLVQPVTRMKCVSRQSLYIETYSYINTYTQYIHMTILDLFYPLALLYFLCFFTFAYTNI